MVGINMEMPSCCVTYTSENDNYTACPFYKICEQRETIKTNYKPTDCPLVEIEERKVGKWIKEEGVLGWDGYSYQCSVCGRSIHLDTEVEDLDDYPYCHCGAQMEISEDGKWIND